MAINHVTPNHAQSLIEQGATLVDIREADERRREHIPGTRHHPLSTLHAEKADGAGALIFHCRSGNRTAANAARLVAFAQGRDVHLLDGGLEAWRDAGMPVIRDVRQPIEIMRQVQIVAGSLVVAGAALGALVHPGFHALSAFVGAGLAFAGATGFCGMARVLAQAPWNRRAAAAA